ncbi:hypothetical protein Tco_0356908 [Tanacetum coccineum]
MAESSNPTQIPSQQEHIPKQEQDTQQHDRLASSNPFEPATQVEFNIDEITFNANNEVALLGILEEVGITTFRNAIRANYLSYSNEYAETPSLETIKEWFPTIGYSGEVRAKGTLKIGFLPPRGHWIPHCPFKKKKSSLAKDTTPSQPPASTPVVAGLHKEDQQATGGSTSLGATSEDRANPQLSSGMSAFIHTKPIYSASTIIHSESASGHDTSADFTAKVDLGKSAPNDRISKQQGIDKGTQNYSLDHAFAGTKLIVLVDKTKSARDGLKTAHTKTCTNLETNKAEKDSQSPSKPSILSALQGDDLNPSIFCLLLLQPMVFKRIAKVEIMSVKWGLVGRGWFCHRVQRFWGKGYSESDLGTEKGLKWSRVIRVKRVIRDEDDEQWRRGFWRVIRVKGVL